MALNILKTQRLFFSSLDAKEMERQKNTGTRFVELSLGWWHSASQNISETQQTKTPNLG